MDFGAILHIAKKNSEVNKNEGKYYSTKFAPPKKESKDKKLSDNIQKFLKKKEEEERRQRQEKMQKASQLMSMRDEKSKNKIRKMLKVTKSANKSVLEDGETAARRSEMESADMDDYGYTSSTANKFFEKYIEKVKDVKDDKGFAPSRPQSIKDLKGTTERVKAAIMREREEKESGHRQSRIQSSVNDHSLPHVRKSSRPVYDPEAERLEEEKKRREAEREKVRHKKPAPPPMDFQALLKLAEKKQYEPVVVSAPIEVKKKEPERLLTMKEKKEMEERQRLKEERERRQKEGSSGQQKTGNRDNNSNTMGRIPKLGQSVKPTSNNNNSNSNKGSAALNQKSFKSDPPTKSDSRGKPDSPRKTITAASSSNPYKPTPIEKPSSRPTTSKPSSTNKVPSSTSGQKPSAPKDSAALQHKSSSNPKMASSRPFPPSDIKTYEAKKNLASSSQKTRQFPPPDVMRSNSQSKSKKSQAYKRRIEDDDDEYDSEMDDFIDDDDEEEDYSSHIKSIFGYDKNKYRDWDDGDDLAMESNFAQVQREEFISKKIGLQEDLEDMKLEAMMKKKKLQAKKLKK